MANPALGLAAHGWVIPPALWGTSRHVTSPHVTSPQSNGRCAVGEDGPAHALPEAPAAPPPASQVPALQADTRMQKVMLPGLVDLTLGNVVVPGRFDPYRIAGFVTRLQDVPARTSAELGRRYGLNHLPGWPASNEVYVLRFYAHSPELYVAPFERNVYQVELLELPAAAELWRIGVEGVEERMGAYLNRQVGWISTAPKPLGPGRWNDPPVSMRPTVRRGPIARFRGQDFDADLGPCPGEVTLHPLPGKPPPEDFTEYVGTFTLAVPIDDLDALEMVRWRGCWQGLPVELVESDLHWAQIHYIGENGRRAAEFGCAEVDYRVWRGSVPHSELSDVQQVRTPLDGCAR